MEEGKGEGEGEGSFASREVGTGEGVGGEGLKPGDAFYLLHIPTFDPRSSLERGFKSSFPCG